jgi:hypothetical protein
MKTKKLKNINVESLNGGIVESPERAEVNAGCETEYDTPDPISATRNGKIARLDRDTREALNRQIQKNYSGADILAWLNAQPKVKAVLDKEFEGQPIGTQNLSQWRHGGYDEWQKQQLAYARLAKKQKGSGAKKANPHQLGAEMAQLYAEELTVTLDDLLVTAPTAEERMKRLDKGLARIQGWRWADYNAQRMALEQKKWEWQCQKEIHAQEAAEEQKEIKRLTTTLIRSHLRNFGEPGWIDLLMDGQSDVDILYSLQYWAWKIQTKKARKKAQEKEAAANSDKSPAGVQSPESPPHPGPLPQGGEGSLKAKKDESEVLEAQGPQKSTKARQSGDALSLNSEVQSPEKIQTTNIQQPTSNIQHPVEEGKGEEGAEDSPESGVQSQSNAEGGMQNAEPEGKGEAEKASTQHSTPINREQAFNVQPATEAASENSQPSTKDTQPSGALEGAGTLSCEEATKLLTKLDTEARKIGRGLPKPWHVASLRAYLTGQAIMWLNPKNLRKEPVQPPMVDPRLDPESPWFRLWKDLGPAMRQHANN